MHTGPDEVDAGYISKTGGEDFLLEDSRHAIQVYEEQVLPTFAEASQNNKVTRNTIAEEQETA